MQHHQEVLGQFNFNNSGHSLGQEPSGAVAVVVVLVVEAKMQSNSFIKFAHPANKAH